MRALPLLFALTALACGAAMAGGDPLASPARPSSLAGQRAIVGLARSGERGVVAVGQRGHVLVSGDAGGHWEQGEVPLSSDLTAVQFVDARTGFAVGHDGVVLRSDDGGTHWTRLLDGRRANQLVLEHLMRRQNAGASGERDRQLMDEARRNAEAGPDKPFLDLWFADANEGFVVGAYNLILHTADGGRSWQPWVDRTDNPKLLNLYAIRRHDGELYIAGEAGLLLKRVGEAFKALASPYQGSFFGLLATPGGLIAYGMRGHAFRSADQGRSWQALATGLPASITAGDVAPDGRVALVDQSGGLALSRDGGASFERVVLQAPMPLSAVLLAADERLVLAGPRGLRAVELKKGAR